MLKRLLISLILVCALVPLVQADLDCPDADHEASAMKWEIVDVSSNCFDTTYLLGMLQMMKAWAAQTYTGNSWGGYFVGDSAAPAIPALNYWMDLDNYADSNEVTAMTVNGGDFGYISEQVAGGGDASSVKNPDEGLYAGQYAYHNDLAVPTGQPTVNVGFYYNRGSSAWADPQVFAKLTTGNVTYSFYGTCDATTPIVLDIDGDGKLEASNGEWGPHDLPKDAKLVTFDMNADGFEEMTEWVGPNDGLLVEYEGGTMTAKNLFGPEGGKYKDGFEKLALLDKDGDKKLTGDELKTLKVWLDKNVNAKVDDGEISAVSDLAITEISVEQKNLVSSFVKDGKTLTAWDWNPCFAMVKKEK